jgi:hypothetical protein
MYYNFLTQNIHRELNTHTVKGRVAGVSNSNKKQLKGTYTPAGIADTAFANKCLFVNSPSRTFQVYSMHVQTSCDVIVSLWHCNVDMYFNECVMYGSYT